ncbi:P-type conjugative transfer protein TrbL [Yersinia enterocolitica]|uniref:Conjugal transfer protein n=1 Tax=Yersinia enterocolitica serotype O:8 / biotype 1B (strain NCTC 13174 / 8081) TaxID=393305 RepID=A1JL45_YERE8|nr:P-type conjugative transfer protein TrbL [Yersinia enterocolitica]AJJ24560.1 P-type conjugative transfer protein TrbL [Yersinia enterocolitica]PNM08744.1 P-type conjugative transfer protein TrbL [Yersinia enterocolitica]CAL11269.1 putative conjugal transfer protein [Yersinia enterocolitica subsp. enterocolitica 8081]
MKVKICSKWMLALASFLMWYSVNATAAIDNSGIMNTVLDRFQSAASGWGAVMVQYASWLFWEMALLSMVWTFGMMALRKADIQEFFAEALRFLSATGFFFWILVNAPSIAMSIIKSTQMIGAEAAGLGSQLQPYDIVDMGFDILFRAFDQSTFWAPVDATCAILFSLATLLILTLIGVQMLLLLVTSWILAYAGIFLLGFGGSRWTSDIAINYYKTVVGVGIQLMMMILLVGIGKTFLDEYYSKLSDTISLKEMAVMLVVTVILYALINKIPTLLAGIVGSGSIQSGIGNFGAGAVMGAASMAGTAAATAASGAISAATSAAGGTSALQAAFESAQQSIDAGSSPSGEGRSSSGGGFSEAMGRAGGFAKSMGSNLADAARDTVQEKASSIRDSVQHEVSGTTGGKIASSIRESTQSRINAGTSQDTFENDSLGAGKSSATERPNVENLSEQEMIDNFVNKTPRDDS